MANFCFNCQRYQSFATERTCILPISMEKQIGHFLVAMVVSPASRFIVQTHADSSYTAHARRTTCRVFEETERVANYRIHVSLLSRKNTRGQARSRERALFWSRSLARAFGASRLWSLRSQNRTSICCLGPVRAFAED
jgi:hypothetical protein